NREGLVKDIGQQIGWRELLAGSLLAVPGLAASAAMNPFRTAIALLAVLLLSWFWAGYVRRRIGGATGDCLGCGCYLGQCVFLLCLTWSVR
ncbi:MAG: adenosylcobinamide-GDP ribazoletransferase, partial [Thermoanaerobaculia bacterium]